MDMVFSQIPFRLSAILIFLVGPTCALQTDLTLTYSNASYPGLQGSTATFVCSWSFDPRVELANQLIFSSTNKRKFYRFAIGNIYTTKAATFPDFNPNRMTVTAEGAEDGSVTLTLSQLECSDEGTYKCVYNHSRNLRALPNVVVEEELVIRVPPSAPTLTPSVDLSAGVLEGGGMDLTCTANVGSKNKGRIRWRLYRMDVPENIANTDSRIQVKAVTQNCADNVTSTLTLRGLTRKDQNLVVACFVSNDDFAETLALPVVCESKGLCDQTETVYIYCAIKNFHVSVDPQNVDSQYTAGKIVTISCYAEGPEDIQLLWYYSEPNSSKVLRPFVGSKIHMVQPKPKPTDDCSSIKHRSKFTILAEEAQDGYMYVCALKEGNDIKLQQNRTLSVSADESMIVVFVIIGSAVVVVIIAFVTQLVVFKKRENNVDIHGENTSSPQTTKSESTV